MENFEKSTEIKRISNSYINKIEGQEFAYFLDELVKLFSDSFAKQIEKCEVGKSVNVTLKIIPIE